jgi:hypothetical protein
MIFRMQCISIPIGKTNEKGGGKKWKQKIKLELC